MLTAPLRTAREVLAERGLLTNDALAVRVGGRLYDLHTPLPEGSLEGAFEVISESSSEALAVLRHSAAHIMADAVQRLFPGTQVTIGPSIEHGFYYDFLRPEGPFSESELGQIEKEMRRIIKANGPFVREVVSREEAYQLFSSMGEVYKLEILNAIPEGEPISLYRHRSAPQNGEKTWVDLCSGPHVSRTGQIGAIKLLSTGGAYWRGDEKNQMLQRIYGTAFRTTEELDLHLKQLEEAKARDHRKLGKELELFMFHEYAPAMPFFLPRGASVYHKLIDYVRSLYERYQYQEVITPQIFDQRLFQTSGHLENYRENMYLPVTADDLEGAGPSLASLDKHPAFMHLGQKPMNCPSHCLIFAQRRRSYRELPWRVADFGRLHRYERGGVVHGLARVRSFCQDDAHIFCTSEQMQAELQQFNRLLFEVYDTFGFRDVSVKLALRPEKRIGTNEQWDHAEGVLEKVLLESGLPFEKLPGEGAFYGPKLEFHVVDALGRSWQLGTIQVDYGLPERFELEYVGADGGSHRPVMLHRAILGSIERFFGMYIEHSAGKFPVWLAPEQATIVTVSEKQSDYALEVKNYLTGLGLRVSLDSGSDKLGAKIRNARLLRTPYIVVVGDEEAQSRSVAPRSRDAGDLGTMSLEEFGERLAKEGRPPSIESSTRPSLPSDQLKGA